MKKVLIRTGSIIGAPIVILALLYGRLADEIGPQARKVRSEIKRHVDWVSRYWLAR